MNTPNSPFYTNSRQTGLKSSWAPSIKKYLSNHRRSDGYHTISSHDIHHPSDAKPATVSYFSPETGPPPTPFPYSQLCAYPLTKYADAHFLHRFLCWCACKGVFIHPAVQISHYRSEFRDFRFTLRYSVPRHVPLMAIPEELVIGFKDMSDESARDDDYRNSELYDRDKEKAFSLANTGHNSNSSDANEATSGGDISSNGGDKSGDNKADICNFFFNCLGSLVGDLITAQKSSLSDIRYEFAESLSKVRNLPNAPYMPENTVFASSSNVFPVSEELLRDAKIKRDELTTMRNKQEKSCKKTMTVTVSAPTVCEGNNKTKKEHDKKIGLSLQQSEHSNNLSESVQGEESECNGREDVMSQNKGDISDKDKIKEECIPSAPNSCMSLPDIVLQMIRNYINGGPLTNKVQRRDLLWTISVCMSHSTPLVIGYRKSIGIIPLVHLMEHGGTKTNCVVLARPPPSSSYCQASRLSKDTNEETMSKKMAGYFTRICCGGAEDTANNSMNKKEAIKKKDNKKKGVITQLNNDNKQMTNGTVQLFSPHSADQWAVDFVACIGGYDTNVSKSCMSRNPMAPTSNSCTMPLSVKTKGYVYVTTLTSLRGGDIINVQAMAPVFSECDDGDSEDMWRLSTGAVPKEYLSSKEVARIGEGLLQEIMRSSS